MNAWLEDGLDALLKATSEQDLFRQVAGAARNMGFEYCAYGIRMPVPVSRPRVAMFNNYSSKWQECYDSRGYLQVDPTVQHALKSSLPVVWSNQLFTHARDMWEDARSHGLRVGWAQASRDPAGAVGLLTLARSAEPLSRSELDANQAKMAWLAQYTHAAMARLLTPKLAPETQIALTPREKEVLRWTAEGKTSYEISQILDVSERTVNFHVNNAVAKLETSNKTQAAVKATALGMLY
ncbi:MAG TPA: autoinducer binding domain-containing protein [Noviherbaspirillum sp.]